MVIEDSGGGGGGQYPKVLRTSMDLNLNSRGVGGFKRKEKRILGGSMDKSLNHTLIVVTTDCTERFCRHT